MDLLTSVASAAIFAGIDVGKQWLDVAVRPSGETWRAANDAAGIAQVVARLQALEPSSR